MLKKKITYTNFNDEEVTKDFYFNLSKTELLDMEASESGSLGDKLKRIIDSKDESAMYREFREIILTSYGVKSDDGERFVKTPELRKAFEQTVAFDVILIELATNSDQAQKFVNGVMPKDLDQFVSAEEKIPDNTDIPKTINNA